MQEKPYRHIVNGSKAFSSYWNDSSLFLNSNLSKSIQLSDSEKMVNYYYKVDDLGDSFVKEIMQENQLHSVFKNFHLLQKSQEKNNSDLINEFLESIKIVPDWVDFKLVEKGADLACRSSKASLASLRNYCLMGGYESAGINKPLIFTEALKKGAVKRLSDTVVFWVNVTRQNGMKPNQNGWMSTIYTRMIHSYSRIQIQKNPNWDKDFWGEPLNQWDMLATQLGFSIVFLDGLQKLGIKPTQDELNGTIELWKYIGYLLGIPLEILPNNLNEAADALYLWSATQLGADDDSRALAKSLYDEPQVVNFDTSQRMKNFIQKANLGYNHWFLGDESTRNLGLPPQKHRGIIKTTVTINKGIDFLSHLHPKFYQYFTKIGSKDQLDVMKLYQSEPR